MDPARKPTDARFDAQGELSDDQRVQAAMKGFIKDFGRTAAMYLETCVHCGMCAEACHFFEVTQEAKYTPIWKIEPFKQAYKREYGPFAPIYKAFNLKPKVTAKELEQWQELLFDACTMCGRCSLMCPMGIDIAALIGEARHGMAQAGLAPKELSAREDGGQSPDAARETFRNRIAELSAESKITIPVDRSSADILCTLSATDILKYPRSVISIARVLNHVGADWTLRSDGFDADTRGLVSGDRQWQREMSLALINAALACNSKMLLLPECGHTYGAMRWEGAEMYGQALPFKVQHISEYMADQVQLGRLKLRKLDKSVTFHDPCQLTRRGGIADAPRVVLGALGADLHEMFPGRGSNWCCGGGGGVVAIERTAPLRHKVLELKMRQIEATEADLSVTSCSGCRQTFDEGQAHFHWDKGMDSLLELVADNLIEDDK